MFYNLCVFHFSVLCLSLTAQGAAIGYWPLSMAKQMFTLQAFDVKILREM